MKILFLASSFPGQNNEQRGVFNYRFVKQMKEEGQNIFVVFFRTWMPGRKISLKYEYDGIEVTQLSVPLLPSKSYFFLKVNTTVCQIFGWLLLQKQLRRSEIIHSVYLAVNSIVASRWANKLQIPHIAQAIGSDVNSDMREMVKKKPFRNWIKRVDGIITNSYDLELSIKKLYPLHPPIKTIYRGVFISDLDKLNENHLRKTFSFLYLGGLQPYKRLEHGINSKGGITLMKAWKKVEKEMYEAGVRLYFGGPNSDSDFFYQWLDGLEFPQAVKLIGLVKPQEVNGYMHKADVVVIPSMEEGMPNLLLESYANKTPVIGSDAGGIPEIIVDGETGYIFKKGNFEELAGLLLKVNREKENNELMGRKAYERVKVSFNASDYSEKIVKFYQNIIN